ncbi:MAG: hypothetical protein KJP00_09790 [Bacteroidia bacterium]|nr:hypothetical protein [Bacteroidia bacterium]
MTKANNNSKRAKLEQFHKELLLKEQAERKDKIVLCSLAISGLIGVFALIFMGSPDQFADSTTTAIEVNYNTSANKAGVKN